MTEDAPHLPADARAAFLGLGAMGSRMAARLVAAGADLAVWSRSSPPVAGARAAASPRAAAEGAGFVFAMARDDAASEAIWLDPETGAFAGMAKGALAIECATVSPGHARRLHEAAAARGLRMLDAPVSGSRPQAEAGGLLFLVGGAAADLAEAAPLFQAMGRGAEHIGGPGAGAVAKLVVNAMLGVQIAAVAELLALAKGAGVDPAAALRGFAATHVASGAAKASGEAMVAGRYPLAFPIDLVLKDLGLVGDASAEGAAVVEAAASVFRRAAAAGLGGENSTAVAKLYGF